MNSKAGKKLRFSDVVYAIDTTPRSLRVWLQRDQVTLSEKADNEGGWAEFSFADIGILALTRRLVHFGLGVEVANTIAHGHVVRSVNTMKRHFKLEDAPAEVLLSPFLETRLVILRNSEGDWDSQLVSIADGFDEPGDAYAVFNIAEILRTAFERAEEHSMDAE
jgi:hypothetical protein